VIAIGSAVGLARVVAEAPRLALAMGFEIDETPEAASRRPR
jgi:hypothetical protein